MTGPQPDAAPSMLEYALGYLMDRKPIFPVCFATGKGRCLQHGACANPGKLPLVAWKKYQTELPTDADITRWWGGTTQANIGMATGELSGVVVLDTDSGDAWKEALRRGIPNTPSVRTGKPGGCHFHFQHPGVDVSNFAGKLAGIDFRGDGGYVLLPPSQHASGARYRWIDGTQSQEHAAVPEWLMALLKGSTGTDGTVSQDHVPLDLEQILTGIPEGQRDETIWRYACKLRGDDVPQDYAEVMVRQAARACRPPFNEDDAAEKVRRAYREYRPSVVLEVPAGAASVPGHEAKGELVLQPYPIQTAAEFLEIERVTRHQLVEGLLWEGQIHWMFSSVNAGKTLLLLALAMHIAAGRAFCGRRVRQGSVLFIQEDSSMMKLQEYLEDLAELFDIDPRTIPLYFNKTQGLRLSGETDLAAARNVVDGFPGKLDVLIMDACESIVPSERYTSKELDYLRRFMLWLVDKSITPIMADHSKQPQMFKGKEVKPTDPMNMLFGGLVKKRVSDLAIHLEGSLKNGSITCTFVKARDEVPDPVELTWNGDTGFAIVGRPASVRTETEHKILRWMNNNRPALWHDQKDIFDGAGVVERSGIRSVRAMTKRGILEHEPSAGKRPARYRVNQTVAPVGFS